MKYSRRSLAALLPGIVASAAAQQSSKRLPSLMLRFEDLPVKANGPNKSHAVLDGETHSGFPVEVHVTELAAGQSPHPPHHHVHEEMFMLQTGILEATINGVTKRITPGSVCYVNSNEEHGIRNPGPERAEYFVLALGVKS
jgi:mannose-6-phosphate isomerase-like protein (cupin superfamily)